MRLKPLIFASLASLLVGIFFFHELELRPLHNDEAVNHYFLQKILREGIYHYSHKNYHGPLYFYSLLPAHYIFGDTITALRVPSIFFTLCLLPALYLFKGFTRSSFFVYATLLILSSASLVFFGRYAIHEPLFLLCSLCFAASCFGFTQRLTAKSLYLASASTALLICVKETFVVVGFSVLLALLASNYQRFGDIGRFIRSAYTQLFKAVLLALFIISFVYSAAFQWLPGIKELVFGIPQWIARGSDDVGHHKAPLYYLEDVLFRTEAGLLVAVALCLLLIPFTWRKLPRFDAESSDKRLFVFLATWTLSTIAIYSLIPYKTPWLVINISLPCILLVAHALSQVESLGGNYKRFSQLSCLLLFLSSLSLSINYNYRSMPLLGGDLGNRLAFQNENPFRYVHTLDVFSGLESKIRKEMEGNPEARFLIAMSGYWPLPFYIREFRERVRYLDTEDPGAYAPNYELIMTKSNSPWRPEGWQRRVYRITKYKSVALYLRERRN